MTGGDITELRYWLDLAIKGLIGIVVSIVGMDYRNLKKSLEDLESHKFQVTMQVEVMQVELRCMNQRLERMEQKLDQALK